MPAAGLEAFGDQQLAQRAAAREGNLETQFIHPAHQREVGSRWGSWPVIDAAPADVQHLGLPRDRQSMGAVDHCFSLGKPALPNAPAQKINLQRQLSGLGMEHRQVHRRSGLLAACFGAKHPGCPVEKLRLPLSNLVGMNVELLSQLGQRLLALDGGQSHLRLESRCVVPTWSSCHRFSYAARILAAFRQKLHLSRCPDSLSHLSWMKVPLSWSVM